MLITAYFWFEIDHMTHENGKKEKNTVDKKWTKCSNVQ